MPLQSVQQNLNQIMQICNQLSQSERNTAQQLQRCVQLAQQISSQMNQLTAGTQIAGPGYNVGAAAGGFNVNPVGGTFTPGVAGGGQFGPAPGFSGGQLSTNVGFETAREFGGPQAPHPVFNTNKDRGE
ncbi:MAG TPA: hypothetical protein GXX19_12220 [Syntrophomonadaceae bacterium]|nr:hypothetical protein [Syntrophomonadaceae bacterium]